jgi:hypothetical protein
VQAILFGAGIFVVFGSVAAAIVWSACRDWKRARADGNVFDMVFSVLELKAAVLAAAVAIGGPVVIAMRA